VQDLAVVKGLSRLLVVALPRL